MRVLAFTVVPVAIVVAMLLTSALGRPPAADSAPPSTASNRTRPTELQRLAEEDTRAIVGTPAAVRWTTVAAVLGDGTESCIDGRSERPVLGTPGGDVGEILVALAALEAESGAHVSLGALDALFDAYEASFGKLYFHSDTHAMAALGASLRADVRFAEVHDQLATSDGVHEFLRAPGARYQAPLLEHVARPESVGCGHLRLALTNADAYGVRAELVRAVIRAAFRLAWRDPAAVDFVVLDGDHHETAVVEVRLPHHVHAHSRLPMLAPHVAGREVFVHHPDIAAFVRRENGTFFLEHARELVPQHVPSEDHYLAKLEALAERQRRESLSRLAPSLPTVHVTAHDPRLDVQLQDLR